MYRLFRYFRCSFYTVHYFLTAVTLVFFKALFQYPCKDYLICKYPFAYGIELSFISRKLYILCRCCFFLHFAHFRSFCIFAKIQGLCIYLFLLLLYYIYFKKSINFLLFDFPPFFQHNPKLNSRNKDNCPDLGVFFSISDIPYLHFESTANKPFAMT